MAVKHGLAKEDRYPISYPISVLHIARMENGSDPSYYSINGFELRARRPARRCRQRRVM
jgi:hypothetical protein